MLNDVGIQVVLEFLKQKDELSELEKDILSTIMKYIEIPFDSDGAKRKIIENNAKYKDIVIVIKMVPGVREIPFNKVSDEGIRDNLKMQIEAMCAKAYNDVKC